MQVVWCTHSIVLDIKGKCKRSKKHLRKAKRESHASSCPVISIRRTSSNAGPFQMHPSSFVQYTKVHNNRNLPVQTENFLTSDALSILHPFHENVCDSCFRLLTFSKSSSVYVSIVESMPYARQVTPFVKTSCDGSVMTILQSVAMVHDYGVAVVMKWSYLSPIQVDATWRWVTHRNEGGR
jgi:hypothetical protein